MGILSPDYEMMDKVSAVVDEVNAWYKAELAINHDIDDIQALAEMLNIQTIKFQLPIEWFVYDDKRATTTEWLSAAACTGKMIKNGKTLHSNHLEVILWENNLEGKWGPITFKELVMQMIGHETIHFNQFSRIGYDRLNDLKSGHQKGLQLFNKTGEEHDYMQCYLRDPHELMAYGHDLAAEIRRVSDPAKALRNPEAFKNELLVYEQYRDIFPPNSKPLQKLLSYAARYTECS